MDKTNKAIYITQPKLIAHMHVTFKDKLSGKEVETPATSRFMIQRPKEDEAVLSKAQQTEYQSGVGMLLYLIKHSRPDINNAVRELTKVMDKATEAHYKAMLRIMQYIMETQHDGLHIKPSVNDGIFKLQGKADSEFCGNRDTRVSVYGFILYFCDVPISWRSKRGKSVTLSSTEAEYFAISELAKEILFVKNALETMGITVEYPMIIHTDNVGAIYLSNNHTTSQRTRHIDTGYHFVREFIEDNIIKIVFVRSEENEADIFTKNMATNLFLKHKEKLVKTVPSQVMKLYNNKT
jgi:hypothetical protein